ncbi:MAG: hypothetical protein AAGJ40_06710 [Planctomycetota bacterium]
MSPWKGLEGKFERHTRHRSPLGAARRKRRSSDRTNWEGGHSPMTDGSGQILGNDAMAHSMLGLDAVALNVATATKPSSELATVWT